MEPVALVHTFLFLSILAVSTSQGTTENSTLRKCCSRKTVLNENLDCVPLKSDERVESDIFHIEGFGRVIYDVRHECSGNVTYVQLTRNFDNMSFYCVDKLVINDTAGVEVLVGLNCQENVTINSFENVEIFTMQKCCPRYYQYNQFKQCVFSSGIDFASTLMTSLLQNNLFNIKYINMRYGLNDSLNIDDVVTDYKTIRSKTYYLINESVNMTSESKVTELDNINIARFDNMIKSFDHACIDIIKDNNEHYVVRAYEPYSKICATNNCLRKCCQVGYSLIRGKKCRKTNATFNPIFNTVLPEDKMNNNGIQTSVDYAVKYGEPICTMNKSFFVDIRNNEKYLSYSNGSIRGDGMYRDIDHYCIDLYYFPEKDIHHYAPLMCSPDATGLPSNDSPSKYKFITFLLIFSNVFAFTTLIVYAILPDLHKKINGKCLMCYFTCVCLLCFTVTVVRIETSLQKSNKSLCFTMGLVTNFSVLATCTWLNVICFDMWNKFRNIREQKAGNESHLKKFLTYSTYGWGVPAIITLMVYVAEVHPTWFPPESRPNFAVYNCWYKDPEDNYAMKVFYIIPMTIFITINIVLFALTAYHCTDIKDQILRMKSVNKEKENMKSKFNSYKVKLSLNFKLFLAMGVFWICDICQRYIETDFLTTLILDTIYCSQGFFIFYLFIFKKRIWKKLVSQFNKTVFRFSDTNKSTVSQNSAATTVFTMHSVSSPGEGNEGENAGNVNGHM